MCTKHRGAVAEKACHKRMHNNELLSGGREENVGEANCWRRACPSHGHERGPGWRLVDGDHERPNIEVAVASRNGSYDNDTGCGRWEGAGTVRRMFIAWQRSNRVVVRVCVFQKRVPQSRIKGLWLTSGRPPGLALPVRSSLIANG